MGTFVVRGASAVKFPPLFANVHHWWDFTDPATVFSDVAGTILAGEGDPIRNVTNKGFDGQPLIEAGAAVPEYNLAFINGLNVATNVGGNTLTTILNNALSTTGITVVIVLRSAESGGSPNPLNWSFGGNDSLMQADIDGSGNWEVIFDPADERDTLKSVIPGEFVWFYGAIAENFFIDYRASGGNLQTGTSGYPVTDAGLTMNVADFIGNVAEVIIYDKKLSAPEQSSLTFFLDNKYDGLPEIIPVFAPPFPTLAPLLHWFDFADPSTVFQDFAGTVPAADGTAIANVTNKGQDGTPITSVSPTQQGKYRTGILNGENIGDFTGFPAQTIRKLDANVANGTDPITKGVTMAAVVRRRNTAAGQNEVFGWSGGYRININNPLEPGDDDLTGLFTPNTQPFINPALLDTWYLVYWSNEAGGSTNDAHFTSPGPEVLAAVPDNLFVIVDGALLEIDFITGDADVAETFYWDGDLTVTERAALVSYVTAKWGVLPSGPPPALLPPFLPDLQHWWDFTDQSQIFADTAGLTPITDGTIIQRVNDKGTAVDDLLDAASGITWHTGVVNGLSVTRNTVVQVPSRFTSASVASAGFAGLTFSSVKRHFNVPGGQGIMLAINNGPSEVTQESGFGTWSEDHPFQGTTPSNKAIVPNEWVEHTWSDGNPAGYIQHVSGAVDVTALDSFSLQVDTPVEIFAQSVDGEIGEILVYDRGLTAAELLTLQAYYDTKYLALPHL